MSEAPDAIEWLPETRSKESLKALGVAGDRRWFVGDPTGYVEIGSSNATVRLLSFLEGDASEFWKAIAIATALVSEPEHETRKVVEAVITAGLVSSREYWASLAMDWIDRLGPNVFSNELGTNLSGVRVAAWASQRTRHRAASICRRMTGAT